MSAQLVHFEIPAPDTGRARAFYGALLGWSFDVEESVDYSLARETQPQAAIGGEGKGTPVVYFGVEDLDAALEQVTRLGGTHDGPQEIPGVGRFAHCRDDQGTAFSLYQPAGA